VVAKFARILIATLPNNVTATPRSARKKEGFNAEFAENAESAEKRREKNADSAQLAPMKDRDPYLYETLVKIVSAVNATSANAGVDPQRRRPRRRRLRVKVQAANGWFDLAITDPAVTRPGLFILRSRT